MYNNTKAAPPTINTVKSLKYNIFDIIKDVTPAMIEISNGFTNMPKYTFIQIEQIFLIKIRYAKNFIMTIIHKYNQAK